MRTRFKTANKLPGNSTSMHSCPCRLSASTVSRTARRQAGEAFTKPSIWLSGFCHQDGEMLLTGRKVTEAQLLWQLHLSKRYRHHIKIVAAYTESHTANQFQIFNRPSIKISNGSLKRMMSQHTAPWDRRQL